MRVRTLVWGFVLAALAVGLLFVPLFDLLGYEFAFAAGIVASLAGAHLGAQAAWTRRREASPADGDLAEARPFAAVLRLWLGASVRVWVLLLPPLVAITLNRLRVRNCDYAGGLVWYAVLPVASAAMGAAAGVFAGLWVQKRAGATLLALAIVFGSLLIAGWRFYAAPPIFAYDPFGGYFPGTPYDEEVAVTAPLLWARLYQLAFALAALSLCALLLDGRKLRPRLRLQSGRGRVALVLLVAAAGAGFLFARRARFGFALDGADVARALGGERRTGHFVLHYAPGGPWAKDLELHARDCELRWKQLAAVFGAEPAGPVHAFLFDSPAQKRALMGASHTFVAKPWRREIYLQHETFPHPVLMHELAHVFAGAFGDPLFGTSRRGATFNVGLIEGVAVAAAFGSAPLTPHELVKVMREAKIEPPIESVLSPHFLGLNASQAYNVAGSFCRFLLDNYGAAPLRTVFRAGGSAESWQAAYGKPFAELASEWRAFINIVLVPDADAQVMRERLRRPSVFHKVCAHELALRKEAARKAIDGNDRTRALAMLESVCRDEPDEPQHLSELLDAAIGAGDRPEEAARIMERLLAHPKVSAPLAARALAARGDLAWRRGDREAAEKDYAEAAARPLDEGNARLLVVKRLAVKEPPGVVAEGLKRFLVQPGARDAALDLLLLSELVRTAPERALLHYLLARQLETRGRYDEAVKELAIAIGDGPAKVSEALPDDRFVRESLRIMGRANFRRGDLAACRATFDRLKKSPGAPGSARLEADDWIARCSETP